MSNNKKILSVILALILALSVIPAMPLSVSAEETENHVKTTDPKFFDYTIENGQATIYWNYDYSDDGIQDVVIPDTLGGYPVTVIDDFAFAFLNLKSITLPEHLERINSVAFLNCTGLTEINIPASVNSIDSTAFVGCSNLQSVTVDENNPTYDSRDNCNAIIRTEDNTLVIGCAHSTIPETVTRIGDSAFKSCIALKSVSLPDGLTQIDDMAFADCTSLKEITIPENTKLGKDVFKNVIGLTIYGYPDSDACAYAQSHGIEFVSIAPVDYSKIYDYTINDGEVTITKYISTEKDAVIPDVIGGYPVTKIGDSAFESCTELKSVSLPDGLTQIGDRAFCNCTSLTEVNIPDTVTEIGDSAFDCCDSLKRITIPENTKLGDNAVTHSYFLTIYGYPESDAYLLARKERIHFISILKKMVSDNFEYTVKDGKASITKYLGKEKDIVIPDTVDGYPVTAVIGLFAWEDWVDWNVQWEKTPNSVVIPASVKYIGEKDYEDGLFSVEPVELYIYARDAVIDTLPGMIDYCTVYGYRGSTVEAFDEYPINFVPLDSEGAEDPDYDYYTYGGKAYITRYKGNEKNVVVPDLLNGYPVAAINSHEQVCTDPDCEDFGHYSYGSYTHTHRFGAFENSGVQSVALPDTVQKLSASAFKNCTALTTIKLSSKLEVIEDKAFYGCSALTEVTFPEGLVTIGGQAFADCTSLKSISIPSTTTEIGRKPTPNDKDYYDYATELYDEYENLISVTVKVAECDSFVGCTALQSITVDKNNPVYDSRDNCNALIRTEDNTLVFGSSHSTIPDTITAIGKSAFGENKELTEINIPSSVTEIGDSAFSGCTGLASVTFSDTAVEIGYCAFASCTALTEITLPDYSTIGGSAFSGCTGLKRAVIPEHIWGLYYSYIGTVFDKIYTIDGDIDYLILKKDERTDLTIYGYYGTVAERYADTYDIPFRMIAPATSDEAVLDAPEGKTYSVVKKATDDEAAVPTAGQLPENSIVLSAYDITLRDIKDEKPVQPDAPVTVRIRCDDPNAHVFRRETDGTLTDMNARYEDGYLIFETDHFSVYMLVKLGAEADLAICGDADGDGKVTITDVTAIQRALVGLESDLDAAVIARNGDADGNGTLESFDATLIQRKLAELTVSYPIGKAL